MGDFEVIIVGAGIAGSRLAALLAPHCPLALIDRDVRGLPGSTGHAPGIVAQINSYPALSELARRSVAHYQAIPGGFDTVGGMEVTMSNGTGALEWLSTRAATARARGLEHKLLSVVEAQRISPFVRDDTEGAIFFPGDGTANAKVVAHTNQDRAAAAGAKLIDGDVLHITPSQKGYTIYLAAGEYLTARRVVVATGIWAGQLLPSLAACAVAFAHPYTYAKRRPKRDVMPPFVRFPCQLVYARDHGDRDGLGSYAHDPIDVRLQVTNALPSAYHPWIPKFEHSLRSSLGLLPDSIARQFGDEDGNVVRAQPETASVLAAKDVPYAFTGMFTITPDGLPLVGAVSDGLYAAVGCWVTQAAGCMGVLADQILADMGLGNHVEQDAWLRTALNPRRFDDIDPAQLTEEARAKYRDIWNKKAQDDDRTRRQTTIIEGVLAKM